jgi:hypothetical protein
MGLRIRWLPISNTPVAKLYWSVAFLDSPCRAARSFYQMADMQPRPLKPDRHIKIKLR